MSPGGSIEKTGGLPAGSPASLLQECLACGVMVVGARERITACTARSERRLITSGASRFTVGPVSRTEITPSAQTSFPMRGRRTDERSAASRSSSDIFRRNRGSTASTGAVMKHSPGSSRLCRNTSGRARSWRIATNLRRSSNPGRPRGNSIVSRVSNAMRPKLLVSNDGIESHPRLDIGGFGRNFRAGGAGGGTAVADNSELRGPPVGPGLRILHRLRGVSGQGISGYETPKFDALIVRSLVARISPVPVSPPVSPRISPYLLYLPSLYLPVSSPD